MPTSRRTFSDGVFAIAITLLVLEIPVPHVEGGKLAHALADQWPVYAAYVVSFATVGIIWINHHAVLSLGSRRPQMVKAERSGTSPMVMESSLDTRTMTS